MAKYLYNGVELPALPEWDKETYPYAFVRYMLGTRYMLIVCNSRPYYDGRYVRIDGEGLICTVQSGADDWVTPVTASGNSYANAMWTNTDILNTDGSVYLAASDPIPVGGAEPIDPTSMLMGWLVGRAVAAQRGKTDAPVIPDEPEKQLIGYSYNGVVLPDINEVWTDKETYPYAVIGEMLFVSTHTLTSIDGALKYNEGKVSVYSTITLEAAREILGNPEITKEEIFAEYGVEVDVWTFQTEADVPSGGYDITNSNPFWTSHDILTTDGTTYLAASDPIPVYE